MQSYISTKIPGKQDDKLIITARNFMKIGKYTEAISLLDASLKQFPTENAYCCKAESLFNLGEMKKAILYFKKAIKLDQLMQKAHAGLAASYVELEKYNLAMKPGLKAHKLNPTDETATQILGYASYKLGNYDNALKYFLKCDGTQPWFYAGLCYLNTGRPSESIIWFDKVLNADSEYHFASLNKSVAYFMKGDFENAIQCIDAEIQYNNDASVLCHKGNMLLDFNCTRDARDCFERSLVLNPYSHEAALKLATTYYAMEEYNKCIQTLEEFPNNPSIDMELLQAEALLELERFYGMLLSVERILRQDSNNKRALELKDIYAGIK